MAFETRYPGEIIIGNNPEFVIFGTAMIDDTFGQVISCTVSREADTTEIEKGGGQLVAYVLSKGRFEMSFDVLFTSDVDAPDLAQIIAFPFAGISGRILPPIEVKWEQKGQRMLTIKATSWDAFAVGDNDGQGLAFSYSGGTYTDLDPAPGP